MVETVEILPQEEILQEETPQIAPQSTVFENLASSLDDVKLEEIGTTVYEGYMADEESREDWKTHYENYTRLWHVRPEHETKNDPWENASNIVLPLINIACSQFWARSLDALFSTKEIVKGLPLGKEADDVLAAERVGRHMNYQLQHKMPNYYEGMSKSMMQLALSGTVIRKHYYDAEMKSNVSDFISPYDFVVNYNTRYLNRSYRYTHVLHENINEMRLKQSNKIYVNVNDVGTIKIEKDPESDKNNNDDNTLMQPPAINEFAKRDVLEQHTYLNLGKKEDDVLKPYIVTVDKETQTVLRIILNENPNTGKRMEYFTKYEFMPAPDDSFYGIGFGMLLERSNETANTLINQLVDAGSLANTQSGIINSRSGLKRGSLKLKRGEFVEENLRTDDIRKALMPIQFKEPSHVLFQLLGLIQDYSNRVTTVSEMFTGEMPASDTTATAVVNLIEQGLKVFAAIYKGLHRSFSTELQKLYDLNGLYVDETEYFSIVVNQDRLKETGIPAEVVQQEINASDYRRKMDVIPVSDPGIISKTEKITKAQLVYETIMQNPLTANNPVSLFAALDAYLRAVDENEANIDKVLKPTEEQVQLSVQQQQQQAQEQQLKQQALEQYAAQLQQGQVPQEFLQQFAMEQQVGQQVIAEQQQQQQEQVSQGKKA